MNLLYTLLVGSIAANAALGIWQIMVIVRFERLLSNASQGAHDHFETIRKVRQRES